MHQKQRVARDRARGVGAYVAETRPIVEVDNQKAIAADDCIAAPDLEAKRRGGVIGGLPQTEVERVGELKFRLRQRGRPAIKAR